MERRVWLARLPETRIAYFETPGALAPGATEALVFQWEVIGALWDSFNDWRVRTRPALGRRDIAAFGLTDESAKTLRAAVPIRGGYQPPEPAKTALFPGGTFAYVYADSIDEIDEAAAVARAWVESSGLRRASDLIEAYKFHYNSEQHPCDCGYLVLNADGSEPIAPALSNNMPLPIARAEYSAKKVGDVSKRSGPHPPPLSRLLRRGRGEFGVRRSNLARTSSG